MSQESHTCRSNAGHRATFRRACGAFFCCAHASSKAEVRVSLLAEFSYGWTKQGLIPKCIIQYSKAYLGNALLDVRESCFCHFAVIETSIVDSFPYTTEFGKTLCEWAEQLMWAEHHEHANTSFAELCPYG